MFRQKIKLLIFYTYFTMLLILILCLSQNGNYKYIELIDESLQNTFKLQNILDEEVFLKMGKKSKIFFIESHVEPVRKLTSARQACSVESAARMNPDAEIYLTFATDTDGVLIRYSELYEVLSEYSNIHLRYVNPLETSHGTILEDFFQKKLLATSKHQIANRADVLRVLLLSKFGGLYLDLDVISLVPLTRLSYENYGCIESKDVVNNAVLNFDVESGHEILKEYGRQILNNYDAELWGAQGPIMLSKVLKTFCNQTTFDENAYTKCGNFTTLPTHMCYEIRCLEYKKFYEDEYCDEVIQRLKENHSFFIHIYNKMQEFGNKSYELSPHSKSAYAELARKHCPKVFGTLEKKF